MKKVQCYLVYLMNWSTNQCLACILALSKSIYGTKRTGCSRGHISNDGDSEYPDLYLSQAFHSAKRITYKYMGNLIRVEWAGPPTVPLPHSATFHQFQDASCDLPSLPWVQDSVNEA